MKSQEALIDQLRYSGAGQGSGDQPSADPDRQLSSLIAQREMDLQVSVCVCVCARTCLIGGSGGGFADA